MRLFLVKLLLSLLLFVYAEAQCSYDDASDREDCGFPGITAGQCLDKKCCWDNSQANTMWCFASNAEADREGKGERGLARQFPRTTAVVQFSGPCLFSCTSIEQRLRLSMTNRNFGFNECLTIRGCYDETDTNLRRRCYFPSRTVEECPAPQCQVPSGVMQLCTPDNVLESTCTALGCCYQKVGSTYKCYRPEVAATIINSTEVPTTTKEPTFIDLLRRNTGGDLQGFSVVDLLSNSLSELTQQKRNRTLLEPTTTTTTTAPTTTTTTVATTPRFETTTTVLPPFRRRMCQWGRCHFVEVPRPVPQCFPTDCGRPRFYPGSTLTPPTQAEASLKKIVGGTRAYPFSYPWMAMLLKTEGERTFLCGATVICERWLVTAAHCFNKQSFKSSTPDLDAIFYTIHVGRYAGWKQKHGTQVQAFEGRDGIAYVQQHPDFITGVNRGILTNDIGLVKLTRPIEFNSYAQPACMPTRRPSVRDIVWATGWGDTNNVGPGATSLKQLGVRILNETLCRRNVPGFEDPAGVLCAGGERNQDTCLGDSGGPLAGPISVGVDRSGRPIQRWVLYGLTSIGSPSCNTLEHDRQPAIYTDVNHFSSWIREVTQNCCA